MQLKEPGAASPRMARNLTQITMFLSCTVPVFALSTSLYRRAPVVPGYLIVGYGCGAVIAVCGCLNFRWVQREEWERFTPGYVFTVLVMLTTVVTMTNLAASADTGVHRVLFVMPVLLAAVVGSRSMIGIVFVLGLAGLGWSTWNDTADLDTTCWTVAVYGAVWLGTGATVHVGVERFLRSTRTAEALAKLAGAAAAANGWPDDLSHCAAEVARALDTDRVVVYSASPLLPATPVARWPVDDGPPLPLPVAPQPGPAPSGSAGIADAVEVGPDGLVIPVVTATDLTITIVTGPSRLATEEIGTIAPTVGRLVGGIAERSVLQAGLRAEARQDLLTGLPNRRSLMEAFVDAFNRTRGSGESLLVVMLDIDHFKRFNDTYGHLEGDRLLRQLGESLNRIVRPFDTAARYGGEEFCLLLPSTEIEGAAAMLTRLRDLLQTAGPEGTSVTYSAGIAIWDGDEDANALIKRADEALYGAKANGRDRVCAALVVPAGDDESDERAVGGTDDTSREPGDADAADRPDDAANRPDDRQPDAQESGDAGANRPDGTGDQPSEPDRLVSAKAAAVRSHTRRTRSTLRDIDVTGSIDLAELRRMVLED